MLQVCTVLVFLCNSDQMQALEKTEKVLLSLWQGINPSTTQCWSTPGMLRFESSSLHTQQTLPNNFYSEYLLSALKAS